MRALRTHRVLSRRVFRYYYHCLRPLAYAKGGSGRLTVMAGFNDGWLEDTTWWPRTGSCWTCGGTLRPEVL